MTKKKQKLDDDKEFVITGVSRAEVRGFCGNAVADRMTDEDMQRLANEMAEVYVSGSYVDDLREIIEQKFSDDDAAEE